jgi:hypothetical protein
MFRAANAEIAAKQQRLRALALRLPSDLLGLMSQTLASPQHICLLAGARSQDGYRPD